MGEGAKLWKPRMGICGGWLPRFPAEWAEPSEGEMPAGRVSSRSDPGELVGRGVANEVTAERTGTSEAGVGPRVETDPSEVGMDRGGGGSPGDPDHHRPEWSLRL